MDPVLNLFQPVSLSPTMWILCSTCFSLSPCPRSSGSCAQPVSTCLPVRDHVDPVLNLSPCPRPCGSCAQPVSLSATMWILCSTCLPAPPPPPTMWYLCSTCLPVPPPPGRQSPPFSPTRSKLPRHLPNSDLDEELMKTGESLRHSVLVEDSAPARFELPRYPIQEKENREYFERQLSHK